MNVQQRKVVGITAAVLLAVVGTVLLVRFVQGAEDRALGGEAANVLVVSEAVAKGTSVDQLAGRVRTETVPQKLKAEGALSSLTSLGGQVTKVDLVKGSQILATQFAPPSDVRDFGVPPGLQQVSIALDAVRSLAGEVREGDTVGVVASFDDEGGRTSHFILHKVRVTGVRTDGAVVDGQLSAKAPTGSISVTLALDAPSVERLVFAAEFGRIWLSAEPPDADTAGTRAQTRGSVLG